MLSTILGKKIRKVHVIPQKPILGIDTDHHGIRMDAYVKDISDSQEITDAKIADSDIADVKITSDIYDIEPNNSYEKKILPRRTRYYHGLIDTQLLSTGTEYDQLPNVIIIMILPYDPFDKNRMFYTIGNHCIEDPDVPYDDGVRKIFLYTNGTEGNPSKELRDMLKYLEETTDRNVTNSDIASIHKLVKQVKESKEVGINYMKTWEREKLIRNEGLQEGIAEGIQQGEALFATLTDKLLQDNRTEDLRKATKDMEYRKLLYTEYSL